MTWLLFTSVANEYEGNSMQSLGLKHGRHWTLDQVPTEKIKCYLCQGIDFTVLCETDRYDMKIVTVGCNGCGLVLTNPQPTDAALDEFYAEFYRRYYQKVTVPSLKYIQEFKKDERAAETAVFLNNAGAIHDHAAVLDIGASEGCILKALRAQDIGLKCVAVEPNMEFAKFAKEYADCEICNHLEDLKHLNLQFDLIILNHVFEHLPNPTAYLRLLSSLLTPIGKIYIDVPDLLKYKGLESLHIAHLYHFTERTLSATISCAGFEVIVMQPHSPKMHPESIRVLLHFNPVATKPELTSIREGWEIIRAIAVDAPRYHRHRLPKYRRRIAAMCDRISSLLE